jgi:hypothetical protein
MYYVALPLSAAWLLSYRATVWTAAVCLGSSLTMALLDSAGLALAEDFPENPILLWAHLVAATVMAAVPAGNVLRVVANGLEHSRLAESAPRGERDLVRTTIRPAAQPLAPHAITSIPIAQRMELCDALIYLDIDRVRTAIAEISEFNGSLGTLLNEYADNFAYTELLHAVRPHEARAGGANV